MTPSRPLPKTYTWPARIALSFLIVGLLADALSIYVTFSSRHATGMAGMGAGYFALGALFVGIVSCAIGALVSSGGRRFWGGPSERRVAFLCLGGMIAGPLVGFACLVSA
jgi:hypothetical protein